VNAAGRSSASRSSNRNYRRNQRARRRPIRGSRRALRSSPSRRGSALRCLDRGVWGHRGPSRTSRAVDDLAKENRYSEHDERRATPSRRSRSDVGQASLLPRIDAFEVHQHGDAQKEQHRTETTAMRRIVQRRTSVVEEVPANPQTAPSPTPDRLRGRPDATGGAGRHVAGGGPRAASRVAASFLGNPSPCDGLVRRSSVCSPSWRGSGYSRP
jgi:hypothetical protein